MKNLDLVKIANKQIEISPELISNLIEQLNTKILDSEMMLEIFQSEIDEHDMICAECFGLVKNTRAEVHVCQSCRTIEGKVIETYEIPSLGMSN